MQEQTLKDPSPNRLGNGQVKPSEHVSARTWWICFLLFLSTAIIYLDRQVLALTADRIIAEFGLTQQGFGQVIAAFRYSYGFFQIFGGFLVDAHGPGIVFPSASGLWSLAGLLTGLATSVSMLIGFRFLLGAGEAFNWPCALKVTNALLPPKDRPLANGIFNSGAAVGALVAPVIVTLITVHYSWRAAFVATGALGGLWVLAWLWFTRGSSEQLKGNSFPLKRVFRVMARILLRPEFWVLAVSAVIINSVNYYLADWIPLYLKTSRGFSFTRGNFLSIVVYGGSSVGNILVGVFVQRLVSRGMSTRSAKRWALFASCVLMLAAIPAGLTPYRYLAVTCLALTGMGVAGFLVIYLTLVQDLEPAYVGVSSGLLGGMGNFAYGYVSPYIGLLADRHKSFLTLILAGLLPWLAFGAIFFGVGFKQR
jgi:MFS transporter, ACS family, hexuronate transporter